MMGKVRPGTTPVQPVGQGVAYIDYLPDDHAEALAGAPVLARPCAACPYTPGTSANLDPVTSRLARECAEAHCAFWCHLTGGDEATHLCAGWLANLGPLTAGESSRDDQTQGPSNV